MSNLNSDASKINFHQSCQKYLVCVENDSSEGVVVMSVGGNKKIYDSACFAHRWIRNVIKNNKSILNPA